MSENEFGFLYPEIDQTQCTNCGLCVKTCPINHVIKEEREPIDYFAAWNKTAEIRVGSTSGGVFSEIAGNIIKKGGVVFGVAWNSDLLPEFKCASHIDEIKGFRGSKYAQAFTKDVYQNVKDQLKKGIYVLFSGTPCQVAGLYNYLDKNYEKLVTIDLVCHGVPSAHLLQNYIRSLEKNNKATNIQLRYKNPFWDSPNVRIQFSDNSTYLSSPTVDPYYILFNVGYSLRESCRYCKFTNLYRVGDITLGDFWNYTPPNLKMSRFDKGVSLVIVNTQRGKMAFESCADRLVYERATKSMALRSNQPLKKPFAPPQDKIEAFWRDYRDGSSWRNLQTKFVPNPMKTPSLLWLRRIVRRYRWLIKR